MRLRALAARVDTEPVLAGAVEDARRGDVTALDLTAPDGAPALRRRGSGRRRRRGGRRPHRAGRDRDRPRGRGPGRARPAACSTRTPSSTTRPGRRCRTSGCRRAPTPSAGGWRCCAGWSTRGTDAGQRPGQGGRRAGALGAAAAGQGARPTSSRSSCASGDEVELDDVVRRLAGAAYPGSTWSSGAASSPSAAASSTSSRRPRSTRCGWSSGATRSRRSARFAVADQRSLEQVAGRPVGAAVPRAAADRRGPRPGRATLAEPHPELREMLDKIADGHAVEGMESLAPVLVDEMELLVDLLPAGTHVAGAATPSGCAARAHDLVATSEEFLQASWAAAAGGGKAPIDLGAAAYRSLGDVRAHALAQGMRLVDGLAVRARPGPPSVAPSPLRDRDRRGRVGRRRRRAGAVESRPSPVRAGRGLPRRHRARASPTSGRWLARRAAASSLRAPRATARRSGWSRCSREHDVAARLVEPTRRARPSRASCTVDAPAALDHGFVARRPSGWSCSPATTSPASGRRPSDMRRMPARRKQADRPARARSPATTSSTSSTASAGSSR